MAARESAGWRGGSGAGRGEGAIWDILSTATGSPHEAPLQGERQHMPRHCGNGG